MRLHVPGLAEPHLKVECPAWNVVKSEEGCQRSRETDVNKELLILTNGLSRPAGRTIAQRFNRHATVKHVIANVCKSAPRFLTSPGWSIKTTSGNMLVEQSTGYECDNKARTMRDFLS